MSRDLRLFLYSLMPEGDIELRVLKDDESFLAEWERAVVPDGSIRLLIHAGFERPSVEQVRLLFQHVSNSTLITEAARWIVGNLLPEHGDAVACLCNDKGELSITIYAAGISQEPSLPTGNVESCTVSHGTVRDSSDQHLPYRVVSMIRTMPNGSWLKKAAYEDPSIEVQLVNIGSLEDSDYVLRRHLLSSVIRDKLDSQRYEVLSRQVDIQDPFELVQIFPHALLVQPITSLTLPIRLIHIFQTCNIASIFDLLRYHTDQAFRWRNYGRKSHLELELSLRQLLERWRTSRVQGIFTVPAVDSTSIPQIVPEDKVPKRVDLDRVEDEQGLWDDLQEFLIGLGRRANVIFAARIGLISDSKTLEEIANELRLSRERVRQIERSAIELLGKCLMVKRVRRRLIRLLRDRSLPLFVDMSEIEDRYFQGFDSRYEALGRLIELVGAPQIHVVRAGERQVITHATQDQWDDKIRNLPDIFRERLDQNLSRPEVNLIVEAQMSAIHARELVPIALTLLSNRLQFAGSDGHVERLVAIGRGLDANILRILSESDYPLHYGAIASLCKGRYGAEARANSVHGRLQALQVVRFAPGTYGLEQHIPLSMREREGAVKIVESVIGSGHPGRQWSIQELLDAVETADPNVAEKIDRHILDYLLSSSQKLRSLGRMVWTTRKSQVRRIDITDATISTLMKAGKPLQEEEIIERIEHHRGTNHQFLLLRDDPRLIRISPGMLGLVTRDVPLDEHQRSALADCLVGHLKHGGVGVHRTEVLETLTANGYCLPDSLTQFMIVSLVLMDKRVKLVSGSYLCLQEWESARRPNIHELIRDNLQGRNTVVGPEIRSQVERTIGHRVPDGSITSALRELGYSYDPSSRSWSLSGGVEEIE